MKRFRQFLDFDKEEHWLNEMARSGNLLVKKRFRYQFRPIEPGRAVVRVDYRDRSMTAADFEDYRTLFADAGWRHLDGRKDGGPQYFAAFGATPEADIFSDKESRAARYKRAIAARTVLALSSLGLFIAVMLGPLDTSLSPASWYLTPGLWDMHGAEFVGRFLFETPFALLRGLTPYVLLTASLVLLAQNAAQYRLLRQATRE